MAGGTVEPSSSIFPAYIICLGHGHAWRQRNEVWNEVLAWYQALFLRRAFTCSWLERLRLALSLKTLHFAGDEESG